VQQVQCSEEIPFPDDFPGELNMISNYTCDNTTERNTSETMVKIGAADFAVYMTLGKKKYQRGAFCAAFYKPDLTCSEIKINCTERFQVRSKSRGCEMDQGDIFFIDHGAEPRQKFCRKFAPNATMTFPKRIGVAFRSLPHIGDDTVRPKKRKGFRCLIMCAKSSGVVPTQEPPVHKIEEP